MDQSQIQEMSMRTQEQQDEAKNKDIDDEVDQQLNGSNEYVKAFEAKLEQMFNQKCIQIDQKYKTVIRTTHNIATDEGATKDFAQAYNQELNRIRAEIFKKFMERSQKILDKHEDPEQRAKQLGDHEMAEVPANDVQGRLYQDKYDRLYQNLFQKKQIGHNPIPTKKYSIKLQQRICFAKLDKDFDSSDDDENDSYVKKYVDQKSEEAKISDMRYNNSSIIFRATKRHGSYPDKQYKYILGQYGKAPIAKCELIPSPDQLKIQVINEAKKSLTFEFVQGDICDHFNENFKGDVIVNIMDGNMKLDGNMAYKFMEGAGFIEEPIKDDKGQVIPDKRPRRIYHLDGGSTEWLRNWGYVEKGGVAITDSYNLKKHRDAKWLLHSAKLDMYKFPHNIRKEMLKRNFTNILLTAKELDCRTLIVPMLGLESNYPVDVVTEIMAKTLVEFHAIEIDPLKKDRYWGKDSQIETVKILIWKNELKEDDTHKHLDQCKTAFNELLQKFA